MIGKIYFQFREKAADKINKKADKQINPDRVIKDIKVFKDKEKMKSYDLNKALS